MAGAGASAGVEAAHHSAVVEPPSLPLRRSPTTSPAQSSLPPPAALRPQSSADQVTEPAAAAGTTATAMKPGQMQQALLPRVGRRASSPAAVSQAQSTRAAGAATGRAVGSGAAVGEAPAHSATPVGGQPCRSAFSLLGGGGLFLHHGDRHLLQGAVAGGTPAALALASAWASGGGQDPHRGRMTRGVSPAKVELVPWWTRSQRQGGLNGPAAEATAQKSRADGEALRAGSLSLVFGSPLEPCLISILTQSE